MKKHIKKRLMFQLEMSKEDLIKLDETGKGIPIEDMEKIKSIPKGTTGLLITENGTVFQSFPYKYEGSLRFIPEPDPVLVYFHSAYMNFREIDKKKKIILKGLLQPKMAEPMVNELYEYFGLTSGFIIFLFTAMEDFINRCIPEDFCYVKAEKRHTVSLNKKQIEEFLPFLEKIKYVLPRIKNKDFSKDYPLKYSQVINLKEFRDSIVHTKASTEGHSPYDYIYKKALNFKYEAAINSVADFCNYYDKPDYIIECPCSEEW